MIIKNKIYFHFFFSINPLKLKFQIFNKRNIELYYFTLIKINEFDIILLDTNYIIILVYIILAVNALDINLYFITRELGEYCFAILLHFICTYRSNGQFIRGLKIINIIEKQF